MKMGFLAKGAAAYYDPSVCGGTNMYHDVTRHAKLQEPVPSIRPCRMFYDVRSLLLIYSFALIFALSQAIYGS